MKIVQVKTNSILVEMDFNELKHITKSEVWAREHATKYCNEDKDIPIGIWADEFRITSKSKLEETLRTFKAMQTFFENRLEIINNFDKEIKK